MFLGKKEISKNVMMNGTSEHDRSSCSSPRYLMESSPQHSPREEVSCRVWGSLFVHLLSSIIIFIQIHFSWLQITMFSLSFLCLNFKFDLYQNIHVAKWGLKWIKLFNWEPSIPYSRIWNFLGDFKHYLHLPSFFTETVTIKYLSTLPLELRSELQEYEELQDQFILSLRFYISTRTTRTTLCQIASLLRGNNTSLSTILFLTADTWFPAWLPHLITKVNCLDFLP